MLRAFAAVIGVLLAGWASLGSAAPCAGFTDVDAADPFCDEVTWMKNRGITLGLTATQYGPNNPVSRLQMALFMYRLGFENAFLDGGNAFNGVARLGTTDNQPAEVLVNGFPALRIEPHPISPNVLAGYTINGLVYPGVYGASIGGGGAPGTTYGAYPCPYAFGCQNSATDHFGTIGGGIGNLVGDTDASLTNRPFGTVGGGRDNAATGYATVGGGWRNQATGTFSTVSGGVENLASGEYSFAVGTDNRATGDGSVAVGTGSRAVQHGCMVFSDHLPGSVTSCGFANQFIARARGGVFFFTGGFTDATYTGAVLAPGTSAWDVYSDRDGKEEVIAADPEEVLRKVVAMPVSTWQWKSEPGSIRHMGPMAQDFHAAFGLGTSEKRIATVDADGVALAAIQGLNARLEKQAALINEQARMIESLRQGMKDIAVLRARMASMTTLLDELQDVGRAGQVQPVTAQ